jgi:5-methylcytosine-specific restriction endonuclease McrA
MTRLLPKRRRLRLKPETYCQLWKRILERDGWRCQQCGSLINLQVHHSHPRGTQGDDAEENLITLCANCHSAHHC